MRTRRALPVLLFSLAAGGCLPGRDNPLDPAKRPAAALLVRDVTTAAGVCPAEGPFDGSSVGTASRGRCLALDARGSSDPDGADDALTFRFFVGGDRELVAPADGVLATNGLLVLGTALRASLPTDVPLTFSVRAEDRGGFRGEDEASLTLTRVRPVVRVPSSRTYPVGGFPWLRDLPGGAPEYEVPLRAAALVTDADSSDVTHLVYCWTLPDGAGGTQEHCSRDDADPAFTLTLPSDVPSVTPVSLRVSDWPGPVAEAPAHPETFSETVFTTVSVRDPSLWIRDENIGAGVRRIDPIAEIWRKIGVVYAMESFFAAPYDDGVLPRIVIARREATGMLLTLDEIPPAMPMEAEINFASGVELVRVVTDPANERIWVLYEGSEPGSEPLCDPAPSGDHGTLRSFDSSLVEISCVRVPFAVGQPTVADLAVDGDGQAWIAARFTANLMRVDDDPAAQPEILAEAGVDPYVSFGLTRRPGTDELWMIRRTQPLGSSEIGEVELVRLDDPGAPPLPLGTETLMGPFWIDEAAFWAYGTNGGARTVDLRLLEEGASVEDATVVVAELPVFVEAGSTHAEVADPFSRALWAKLLDGALRVGADGTVVRVSLQDSQPLFVDGEGALWFSARGDVMDTHVLRRGLTMDPGGVVALRQTVTFAAQSDIDGGGAWIGNLFTPGVERVNEDGTREDLLETYVDEISGQLRGVPSVSRLAAAADGSRLWIGTLDFEDAEEPGALLVVDPIAGTGRTLFEAGDPELDALNASRFAITASAPLPGEAPFAWATMTQDDGTQELVQIDVTGAVTTVFTLPQEEADASRAVFAVSLRTGAVCLASRDADEVIVRYLLPGAVAVELGRTAAPSGGGEVAIGADTEGRDMCWTVTNDGTERIEGFLDDGDLASDLAAVLNAVPFAGAFVAGGLSAAPGGRVWAALNNGGTPEIVLFGFPGAAGLPLVRFTLTGEPILVTPEQSGE